MDQYTIHNGFCGLCNGLFHFHWQLVPCLSFSGQRLPVCEECIDGINLAREEEGLDPLPVHPDAYQDPMQGGLYE
jgi:hypothetical protein